MSLSAFVIRPFGKKEVVLPGGKPVRSNNGMRLAKSTLVDFERVHNELIVPALVELNIRVNTTEAFMQAGNIREDMFHLLMTADLVVADITYHNPNVYYELGIRHAFRDRFTFLMRSEGHEDPFDLKTDRYFSYDHDHPASSVEKLVCAIRATVSSERTDSPVFRLLPRLRSEDRARFISVPQDFLEAVERAKKYRRPGDLRLLAVECQGFLWEIEGLRAVGRAQFELNFMHGAQTAWEAIVRRYPDDVEGNMILSTVYLRISDGNRAEEALARIAKLNLHDVNTVSEVRAMFGRNYKAKWTDGWHSKIRRLLKDGSAGLSAEKEHEWNELRRDALRSPLLRKARQEYVRAYQGNLNYTYAGLNALSLMLVELSLAHDFPETWDSLADSKAQAAALIKELEDDIDRITSSLSFGINVEKERLLSENRIDFWFEIEEAAFLCITSNDTDKVRQNYLEALVWAPESAEQSMRPALLHYEDLQVRHPDPAVDILANVNAALKLIKEAEARQTKGDILLFVGLRIPPQGPDLHGSSDDRPGRFLPLQAEAWAKDAIRTAIESERANGRQFIFGMAAGACGTDILFHEVCDELTLESRLYLALPKDQYVGEYVAAGGAGWIDRFHKVYADRLAKRSECSHRIGEFEADLTVNVLADSTEMPRWLQSQPGYTVGKRNAVWMLQHALVQRSLYGAEKTNVTMIALWDRKCKKDRKGDIGNLVDAAEKSGVKIIHIDTKNYQPTASSHADDVLQNKEQAQYYAHNLRNRAESVVGGNGVDEEKVNRVGRVPRTPTAKARTGKGNGKGLHDR